MHDGYGLGKDLGLKACMCCRWGSQGLYGHVKRVPAYAWNLCPWEKATSYLLEGYANTSGRALRTRAVRHGLTCGLRSHGNV